MENKYGFCVTGGRFKYVWYDDKTNDQMLIDLKKDPGEEVNLMPALRGHFAHKPKSKAYLKMMTNKYKALQKALLIHLKYLNRKGANIKIKQFQKSLSQSR